MNNRDGVTRALLIGGATAEAARLASAISPGSKVIAFTEDRASADALKATFARHGVAAAVMLGDAGLLVHKVAGPFDVIVDAHPGHAQRRERLTALLAPDGRLKVEATADRKAGSTDE
jgi:protein-L-isoaspartate O-methyltransferase